MRAVWRLRATACIRCKRRSGTERLTRSHSGKDAIALRLSLSSPEARGDAGLASDTIHPELDHMPAYAILSHIACQSGQFGGAVVGAFPQTEDAVPCAYVTQLPDVNRIDLPWRRDAIMDELQDDPVRVARMRRDLDIPQFSQAFPHADDAALEKLFYGSAVVRDNIGAFLDVDALKKHLSMKILYYKKEHAFNGVTDLLAPIAHVQLTGRKLLLGAPLASIIAAFTVSESNTGVAMTVANLVKHMVGMTAKDFVSAGGFWVILNPGSLAVTPSSCLIMEYGVDDMGSTLSWPAFMRGHCDPSEIATVRADISQLLQNCCHATDKLSETHFTVADRFYVCVTELASASNVKTEQAQVLMRCKEQDPPTPMRGDHAGQIAHQPSPGTAQHPPPDELLAPREPQPQQPQTKPPLPPDELLDQQPLPELALREPQRSEPEPTQGELALQEPQRSEPEPAQAELALREPQRSEPKPPQAELALQEPQRSGPEPPQPELALREPQRSEPEPTQGELALQESQRSEPEPAQAELALREPQRSEPKPPQAELALQEPQRSGPEPPQPELALREPQRSEPEPPQPELALREPQRSEPEPPQQPPAHAPPD
ncbi:unnamed protein product, partial [Effrenium voratum]